MASRIKSNRRKGIRGQADQERRFVQRNPMPEHFGIKRPLGQTSANVIIGIGSMLMREMQTRGRLPDGLDFVTDLHVEVFARKKFPQSVAGALAIGREMGLTEYEKDQHNPIVGPVRVAGHLGKVVSNNKNRNIDIQVHAPRIIRQTLDVYDALAPLNVKPPQNLNEDTLLRMRLINGTHPLRNEEIGSFANQFGQLLRSELGDSPLVYFGKSDVYPDLSNYKR